MFNESSFIIRKLLNKIYKTLSSNNEERDE